MPKKPGHGRRGYQDLINSTTVEHPHPILKPGDPCPDELCDGKVYPLVNPGVYIRITASEPVSTTIHLTEKFRCNLCGETFEECPSDVQNSDKYDESVLAHIIMHKCFYGVAHNRNDGDAIAASTQSELFAEADDLLSPVFEEVVVALANGDQISFDDTNLKIQPLEKGGSKTAWGSAFIGRDIVVNNFYRYHAGINLKKILEKRSPYLYPPILMSDALPSYESYKKDSIDSHCLTHGRRRFKVAMDEDEIFCQQMIDLIAKIYEVDKRAKSLSDLERQQLHAMESTPVLNKIMDIVQEATEEKKFMPNSELGKAAAYWDEHFNKLTNFIRIPGVPLDTNHVERGIKSPIRIRKQAPIFKTLSGAERTGRMLSLVETCLYNKINARSYLIWALKGRKKGQAAIELTPWMFKRCLETEQRR